MFYELYKDTTSQWRWRLKAANYRTIANSGEGYYNKSDALAAIQLVKSSGPSPIHEV